MCGRAKREEVLLLCGHVATCEGCEGRVKRCPLCKETVTGRNKVGVASMNFGSVCGVRELFAIKRLTFALGRTQYMRQQQGMRSGQTGKG